MAPIDAATNITKFRTSAIGATLFESPWAWESPHFPAAGAKNPHPQPRKRRLRLSQKNALR
jgi:hypothetical protein